MAHEHANEKCRCCGKVRTPNDDSFTICKSCRRRVNKYAKEYKIGGMTSGHFTKAEERVAEENNIPYVVKKQSTKKKRPAKKKHKPHICWHNLPIPKIGVYILFLEGEIQYIGKAEDNAGGVNARVADHMRNGAIPFDSVKYTELSAKEVAIFEPLFIASHNPPYNKKGKTK